MQKFDIIVIGGGIVGISAAWQFKKRYPKLRMLLLEKEQGVARHQTGRNSGVIHAGVYYEPGSLKARFCREGNRATVEFCKAYGIPFNRCGKMLVATDSKEHQRMERLYGRILKNGIRVERLDARAAKAREPHISGLGALFVPDTGIVDYRRVAAKMADLFKSLGGEVRFSAQVTRLAESSGHIDIETTRGGLASRFLVACAGLHADRLVERIGMRPNFRIIPFRGEYFQLSRGKRNLVRHLIYPIPDPELPFLGIHLTRMIDGGLTAGPNAVLGLKREGYRRVDIDFREVAGMLAFRGFRRMMRHNIRPGLMELKNSLFKTAYLQQVRKYCPEIQSKDLSPYPSGVRAQAVAEDGTLLHDFLFRNSGRSIHVCNAPSPAATSAIPIGGHIVERAASLFGL